MVNPVAILIIAWFITGRQLGHFGAKYARKKKESILLFTFLLIISTILTVIYFNGTIN